MSDEKNAPASVVKIDITNKNNPILATIGISIPFVSVLLGITNIMSIDITIPANPTYIIKSNIIKLLSLMAGFRANLK